MPCTNTLHSVKNIGIGVFVVFGASNSIRLRDVLCLCECCRHMDGQISKPNGNAWNCIANKYMDGNKIEATGVLLYRMCAKTIIQHKKCPNKGTGATLHRIRIIILCHSKWMTDFIDMEMKITTTVCIHSVAGAISRTAQPYDFGFQVLSFRFGLVCIFIAALFACKIIRNLFSVHFEIHFQFRFAHVLCLHLYFVVLKLTA